jgi:hypothetical protein
MKNARVITLIGSMVLFASGILHWTGYPKVTSALAENPTSPMLASVLKTCWITFSVEMVALALIAFVARSLDRGGSIVLLCAAANAANGFLLFHFLGAFIGVYLVAAITLLFFVGGYLQVKASPRTS